MLSGLVGDEYTALQNNVTSETTSEGRAVPAAARGHPGELSCGPREEGAPPPSRANLPTP
eukprot:3724600-Pyramimonas_sp.AAC.1